VQRQSFARAYIEANRPADALVWLQDSWGHMEDSRQGLLAEALEKLGRFDESVPIRRAMFERTLSDYYLDLWLKHLAEPARADAIACARKLALAHKDPARAATVLLQIGDADAAEEKLLTNPGGIDGGAYGSLVPLAKALRNHDCPRGETVIYRALLKGILERAYARAYGHAARYWSRLQEIANGTTGLLPLSSHNEFEAEIRARHGRKTAFWAHVNGTRRDRHDVDDDE
jgi:tetratricopeptide (TPR) repeat protein